MMFVTPPNRDAQAGGPLMGHVYSSIVSSSKLRLVVLLLSFGVVGAVL